MGLFGNLEKERKGRKHLKKKKTFCSFRIKRENNKINIEPNKTFFTIFSCFSSQVFSLFADIAIYFSVGSSDDCLDWGRGSAFIS